MGLFLSDGKGEVRGGLGVTVFSSGLLVFLVPLVILALFASTILTTYLGQFVLVSGIVTLLLAFATLRGWTLVRLPGVRVDPGSSGYRALFVMGAAYIVAAVGCTPGIFVGVTATAVSMGSTTGSGLVLTAFVASILVPTFLLSLFAHEYRDTYGTTIRRLMEPLKRASLVLMFAMGAYLIVFYVLFTFYGLPV